MQNAGPAPNKPTAPVMPAAMGGRRSRGGAYNMMKPAMGGRPPVMMTPPPNVEYAEGGGRSRRSRGGAYNMMKPAMGGRPPVVMPAPPPTAYAEGGRRGGKTRKASPWNLFVKKVYGEMKRKHGKGASFSDALKEASRRKKEM